MKTIKEFAMTHIGISDLPKSNTGNAFQRSRTSMIYKRSETRSERTTHINKHMDRPLENTVLRIPTHTKRTRNTGHQN